MGVTKWGDVSVMDFHLTDVFCSCCAEISMV